MSENRDSYVIIPTRSNPSNHRFSKRQVTVRPMVIHRTWATNSDRDGNANLKYTENQIASKSSSSTVEKEARSPVTASRSPCRIQNVRRDLTTTFDSEEDSSNLSPAVANKNVKITSQVLLHADVQSSPQSPRVLAADRFYRTTPPAASNHMKSPEARSQNSLSAGPNKSRQKLFASPERMIARENVGKSSAVNRSRSSDNRSTSKSSAISDSRRETSTLTTSSSRDSVFSSEPNHSASDQASGASGSQSDHHRDDLRLADNAVTVPEQVEAGDGRSNSKTLSSSSAAVDKSVVVEVLNMPSKRKSDRQRQQRQVPGSDTDDSDNSDPPQVTKETPAVTVSLSRNASSHASATLTSTSSHASTGSANEKGASDSDSAAEADDGLSKAKTKEELRKRNVPSPAAKQRRGTLTRQLSDTAPASPSSNLPEGNRSGNSAGASDHGNATGDSGRCSNSADDRDSSRQTDQPTKENRAAAAVAASSASSRTLSTSHTSISLTSTAVHPSPVSSPPPPSPPPPPPARAAATAAPAPAVPVRAPVTADVPAPAAAPPAPAIAALPAPATVPAPAFDKPYLGAASVQPHWVIVPGQVKAGVEEDEVLHRHQHLLARQRQLIAYWIKPRVPQPQVTLAHWRDGVLYPDGTEPGRWAHTSYQPPPPLKVKAKAAPANGKRAVGGVASRQLELVSEAAESTNKQAANGVRGSGRGSANGVSASEGVAKAITRRRKDKDTATTSRRSATAAGDADITDTDSDIEPWNRFVTMGKHKILGNKQALYVCRVTDNTTFASAISNTELANQKASSKHAANQKAANKSRVAATATNRKVANKNKRVASSDIDSDDISTNQKAASKSKKLKTSDSNETAARANQKAANNRDKESKLSAANQKAAKKKGSRQLATAASGFEL